jgi:septal ring factor EnvC (AmiA/AmiB activator)
MESESLKLLEARVDEFLTRHAAVCRERDELRQQLGQAHARLAELGQQLAQQEHDRARVKAQVERIMSRLEGIDLG